MSEEIKQIKTKMLEEAPGETSAMRVMCFLSFCAAAFFGFLSVPQGDAGNGLQITLAFLVAAFAPKAIQKFAEK